MESRSSKIYLEIYRKPEKNISDLIDCNSKKDWQILIIFGKNTSNTTSY